MEPDATREGATLPLRLARLALVTVVYYVAARFGEAVIVDEQAFSPIWLASGTVLVATLRWGPLMALGALFGETVVALQSDFGVVAAAFLGIGNALEPLVAVAILHSRGFGRSVQRIADVYSLLLAAGAAAALSASIGVAALRLTGTFDASQAPGQWIVFWSSVVVGNMLLVPLLLSIPSEMPNVPHVDRVFEAGVVGALVLAVGVYTLDGNHPYGSVLLFPLFTWAALRFGVAGAAGSILLATAIAVRTQLTDQTALPGLGLDQTEMIIAVQAMLATVAAANLSLATLLLERDHARDRAEGSALALADAQAIASLGSWEWDPSGSKITCSVQLFTMLDVDAVRCGTIDDLLARVHVDDVPRLRRAIDGILDGDSEFSLQHRVLSKAGGERIVEHVGRVVDAGGRRVVATLLDVTQRTSVDRMRDALIATASHELRTPLTSIVGFADTLVTRWDDFDQERRLEFIRIIGAQGQRLSSLVDDTLMQSQLDAGSLTVRDEPYVVADALRGAVDLAQLDDVTLDCDDALVGVGSAEHLSQVVVNFLTNAAKYGAPPIRVEARYLRIQDRIEVRVLDHGGGIDDVFRVRMFDRFTRGPGTDARPGTGLGLSIVRGLAEANGGKASYRRENGRTIFAVTIRPYAHTEVAVTQA